MVWGCPASLEEADCKQNPFDRWLPRYLAIAISSATLLKFWHKTGESANGSHGCSQVEFLIDVWMAASLLGRRLCCWWWWWPPPWLLVFVDKFEHLVCSSLLDIVTSAVVNIHTLHLFVERHVFTSFAHILMGWVVGNMAGFNLLKNCSAVFQSS